MIKNRERHPFPKLHLHREEITFLAMILLAYSYYNFGTPLLNIKSAYIIFQNNAYYNKIRASRFTSTAKQEGR